MKKIIIVLAVVFALVLAVNFVYARGWGGCGDGYNGSDKGFGPGQRRGFRHLEFMKTELGLSDKQVKQVFDIGTQYREKYFENRTNPDKLTELRTEHRKAVESVLTKDQLEKFNNLRNNKDNNRRGGCPYR